MDIIKNNENAYYEKYGISLQERWNRLSSDVQDNEISKINEFIENGTVEDLGFESEDILRIIIGYRGRRSLYTAIKKALPTADVIIWEPDEALFLAGCIREDISDFLKDNRISIVFGSDEKPELENTLRNRMHDHNISHRSIKGYGEYANPDNKEVAFFSEIFRSIAGEVTNCGNARKRFHQLPSENILYALSRLGNNSTVEQLFEIIPTRDIPVIIVAAGPSLEKNCSELVKAKGKAIIVAVTHAMKTLDRINFVPDLIAVTDATETDYMDFERRHEYTLISSAFASRACQEEFDGHIVYHGFDIYDGVYIPKRTETKLNAQLDTGSVATDVFSLFLAAGFRKFIMVGQDLAYDEKGYSHTGGEIEGGLIEVISNDKWIEGIYGGLVRTRNDWLHFKNFYENMISLYTDAYIVDATEGGALIHGTRILSLKEAINELCVKEFAVSNWINNIKKGNRKETEEIKDWFAETETNCEDSRNWLEEAISLNKSIQYKWDDKDLWDDEFRASCKRYDVLYNIIINGSRSIVLRSFCVALIQQYIEDALVLEGDENIERRMQRECELITNMKSKADELLEYIRSLRIKD